MKKVIVILVHCVFTGLISLSAQTFKLDKSRLEAIDVSMSIGKVMGKEAVKVVRDSSIKAADEPTFVKLKGIELKDGTIEVSVLSRLLPGAPETARGFIGVAFRIEGTHSKFESIYLRPTNGRSTNQIRRNHSIQYFSYPDYKFDRLRKEAPEQYESYADMGLNEWIRMKIVVRGQEAKLFLNDNKQPSLIVNDLKHGENLSGAIGLWVDQWTEGYFSDVKVQPQK